MPLFSEETFHTDLDTLIPAEKGVISLCDDTRWGVIPVSTLMHFSSFKIMLCLNRIQIKITTKSKQLYDFPKYDVIAERPLQSMGVDDRGWDAIGSKFGTLARIFAASIAIGRVLCRVERADRDTSVMEVGFGTGFEYLACDSCRKCHTYPLEVQ